MYVFLSPHFDDAIGSCGGVIRRLVAAGEKVCVMTLMGRVPLWRPCDMIYVMHRCAENRCACRRLGCRAKSAPFFDAVYRPAYKATKGKIDKNNFLFATQITERNLIDDIRQYIIKHSARDDIIIAPAGLGNHIDHRIVRDACDGLERKVCFYEEFFYDQDGRASPLTADYEYAYLNYNELATKIDAMRKYKRTLQKLYGKANTMEKMSDYFTAVRIHEGMAYERFNDIGFLKKL